MMGDPKRHKHTERRLRVGDRVSFRLGVRRVKGTIIEDRGPIGFKGRRLLAVRVRRRNSEDLVIEMPAEELRAA